MIFLSVCWSIQRFEEYLRRLALSYIVFCYSIEFYINTSKLLHLFVSLFVVSRFPKVQNPVHVLMIVATFI
jgi:hypothetical protein